jgi:isoaspartyl peptidase/L-asparaginase-like protein (Ntn-hydrolase superfamily)
VTTDPRRASIPVLLVHGGAGPRGRAPGGTADAERRSQLALAVEAGWRELDAGAAAEAACVAAVRFLEDSPLFNAGTGSALAVDGRVWCDASLMTAGGLAGAVATVEGIRHPILAAQALAHAGGTPLLWAGRSEELAARHGLELLEPSRMVTERQQRRLRAQREGTSGGAGTSTPPAGTVGAVCLDAAGGLAAATSTGGYSGKLPARVGDSAILGAGTWAHRLTCAVSATGDGEAFIRAAFAHEIHARMLHAGESLAVAADAALAAVGEAGGVGGAICVDAGGAIAMPISSEVMHRAWRRAGGRTRVAVGAEETGDEA